MSISRYGVLTAFLVTAALLGSLTVAHAAIIRSERVPAYGTHTWTVWAEAGEGGVAVVGDGATDLDLYVYDSSGTLLGKHDDVTDHCVVTYVRPSSGNLTVRIRNRGNVYNEYLMYVR